ncbi:hypothetical protein BCR43DRAFT_229602 [Syncephalastrum racemosum]|uniref:Uncharacterized protein n=1 Tax=Syncephalastrum racemosum TaxID=13706 RepID=A0A1X2HK31_SYNRA|nr:hypothetical protein BCR43DRAFT_229491 [Syncephalastrum racemosum]ORY99453.1 hypothetical protein BCR43DRAFT_229602 [Syncephalastrum racemosum]
MFEAGLDYLNRMKPALWDASTVITLYRNEKPTLLPGELISRIIKDLEELGQRRPTMKKPIEKLLSTLKCVHALDQAFTPAEDHSETVNKSKSDEVAPTSKVADIWNSHGNVTINQSNVKIHLKRVLFLSSLLNHSHFKFQSRHKRKENDDASNVPLDVKKGKKSFSFVPQLKPSTSTHKSRVSEEDRITLAPLYHIKINDDHTAYTPTNIIHDYEQNIDDQAVNASLSKRPLAYNFLKQALNEPLANLRQFLWTHGQDDHDGIEGSKEQASDKEEQLMELIRLVLTDYSTICLKPQYPAPTNERTPFVESIIPLFKYMSSITKSIAFVW